MKDRLQKQMALKLSVANRWFPQLEVDVQPPRALAQKVPLVTDLDVFSSIPDHFRGYRSVVFDCKTGAKESPVNRALWLAGVLGRVKSEQGFCILKKDQILIDHRLMANGLNVVLLAEDEFELYASVTSANYSKPLGNVAQIDLWDALFRIPERYKPLEEAMQFLRSTFWMADDAAESCRKLLACLRSIQPELDPSKSEHVAVFFDCCALFSRMLAVVVCQVFKAYLHPKNQTDLAEALLILLYGGRESYQHRNELFKLVKARHTEQAVPELALPEWDRFVQLVRQCLDAPFEAQYSPLILREIGFTALSGNNSFDFARVLCTESPQAARFAVLIASYLARSVRLPHEFEAICDANLLPLIPAP